MEEDAPMVMEKWNVLMAGQPVTFDMRHVFIGVQCAITYLANNRVGGRTVR